MRRVQVLKLHHIRNSRERSQQKGVKDDEIHTMGKWGGSESKPVPGSLKESDGSSQCHGKNYRQGVGQVPSPPQRVCHSYFNIKGT